MWSANNDDDDEEPYIFHTSAFYQQPIHSLPVPCNHETTIAMVMLHSNTQIRTERDGAGLEKTYGSFEQKL